jgi:hypothetical protein
VLDVDGTKERLGWVAWEEGGLYPHMIVELMSPSTARIDTGRKKGIYERVFKTADYFVFDPFEPNSLQGWHLDASQRYQPLVANERGWLWCERLGFWLGSWEGTIDRETAVWLRFYDREGNLVLLPDEAAQQLAEQERQRAEQAEEQAQQAQQQAEQERQRAEQAEEQAQQAQQLVEQERQRAEQESQRAQQAEEQAQQAQQRAERLAAQLRAMGVDPDTV